MVSDERIREGFKKKVRTLVGWVGLKKSFSAKKNMVSKCIKSPKYSFKSNLFFSYGGGVWHLEYFWDPNGCYFWLFQWEKIIFCQNAYFCLKMIFRPFYFSFFFCTLWVGWVGFEKCEKFRTFFFETFPNEFEIIQNF